MTYLSQSLRKVADALCVCLCVTFRCKQKHVGRSRKQPNSSVHPKMLALDFLLAILPCDERGINLKTGL